MDDNVIRNAPTLRIIAKKRFSLEQWLYYCYYWGTVHKNIDLYPPTDFVFRIKFIMEQLAFV